MSRKTAIAIAAHPDDIELKMAGTLLRLKETGWEIHYCNLANAHGVPNYETDPPRPAYFEDISVYHCMPHGGRNRIRQRVMPGAFVDTTDVHAIAREALAAHKSQQAWLDSSQGMNNYLVAMDEHAETMGKLSGKFPRAEGWWRHLHLGFSTTDSDPLGEGYLVNADFENAIAQPAAPNP